MRDDAGRGLEWGLWGPCDYGGSVCLSNSKAGKEGMHLGRCEYGGAKGERKREGRDGITRR